MKVEIQAQKSIMIDTFSKHPSSSSQLPKKKIIHIFKRKKDMQGFFNIIVHCSKLKKHQY